MEYTGVSNGGGERRNRGQHADRTRGEAATKGGREDEKGVVHTAQLSLVPSQDLALSPSP